MNLIWHDRLYVGKLAGRCRRLIWRRLGQNRYLPGVFVITPASGGHNILDIYPAWSLLQEYYENRQLLVIGIAVGYGEALSLAGKIVEDMYRETGGFCLEDFL